MRRYHDNMIVALALFLAPYLIVAWTWWPTGPARLTPVRVDGQPLRHLEFDRADASPVMHAIDPLEARQRMRLYTEHHRPPMHEREAVFANPSDGRELVDRYVTSGAAAHWNSAESHKINQLRAPLHSQSGGRTA